MDLGDKELVRSITSQFRAEVEDLEKLRASEQREAAKAAIQAAERAARESAEARAQAAEAAANLSKLLELQVAEDAKREHRYKLLRNIGLPIVLALIGGGGWGINRAAQEPDTAEVQKTIDVRMDTVEQRQSIYGHRIDLLGDAHFEVLRVVVKLFDEQNAKLDEMSKQMRRKAEPTDETTKEPDAISQARESIKAYEDRMKKQGPRPATGDLFSSLPSVPDMKPQSGE